MLFLGLPSIVLVFKKLTDDQASQKKLLIKLESTNRKYLFDPGTTLDIKSAVEVVEDSVIDLQYAAGFLSRISEGNYDGKWEGMKEENKSLNKENLAGKILSLREDLRRIKHEEEKRFWTNEGLALFAEVLRTKSSDLKELAESVLTQLINYIKANQGGFYVINDDSADDPFIEMIACFAYDRKKHQNLRIELGEGLVGQTVLEKETTYMKQLPRFI
jgi:hypothetical protein